MALLCRCEGKVPLPPLNSFSWCLQGSPLSSQPSCPGVLIHFVFIPGLRGAQGAIEVWHSWDIWEHGMRAPCVPVEFQNEWKSSLAHELLLLEGLCFINPTLPGTAQPRVLQLGYPFLLQQLFGFSIWNGHH